MTNLDITNLDITTIEASIEALIRQQVAAFEAQLRETLGRRLSAAGKPPSGRKATRSKRSRKRASAPVPRRSTEELKILADQFFDAVVKAPGETMATLAAGLGLRGKELERPVSRLKREGRIKTVGERNRTRYYPLTPRAE